MSSTSGLNCLRFQWPVYLIQSAGTNGPKYFSSVFCHTAQLCCVYLLLTNKNGLIDEAKEKQGLPCKFLVMHLKYIKCMF